MATYSDLPINSGSTGTVSHIANATAYTVPAGRRAIVAVVAATAAAANVELRDSGANSFLAFGAAVATAAIFVQNFHLDEGQDVRVTAGALDAADVTVNYIEYTKP